MGIDTHKVQICIWSIFKILISFCLRFVHNHPYVSSTLTFLFFLYVYYPFILKFLIYSSPIIIGSVVYIRFHLNSQRPKPKILNQNEKEKKYHGLLSGKSGSVEGNFYVGSTNVLQNISENNKKECDDLRAKNLLKNENLKETQNEAFIDNSSVVISRNGSDDWSRKVDGSTDNLEALNMEEDDDEEETQEDRNKAVEWNEDDQKNLMELGTSEIERNKRLESLIAKRRARKVLSMQVQRNLIDLESGPPLGQVAPILIAKNNPFDVPCKVNEADCLQIPSSAPSVMLQMKNPFDLPYDPHEEKPILTGDSFEKDFMVTQKDFSFCRHESFSLGPTLPWEAKPDLQDPNLNPFFVPERRVSKGPEVSRFRRQSDDNLVEKALALDGELFPHSETARYEGDSLEKVVNRLGHNHDIDIDNEDEYKNVEVKGGEEKENDHAHVQETAMDDFALALKDSLQKSFTCPKPKKISIEVENISQTSQPDEPYYDSSPTASGKPRMDEQMFYEERIPGHTPSFSIASDMQVEVSDAGSPPLTVGTVSPPDAECVSYEGDVDKEIISHSSHLSGIEDNESRSRAVHEISEEDIIEVGFSSLKQSPNDSIASFLSQEEGQTQEAQCSTGKLPVDPSSGDDDFICSKVSQEAQSLPAKLLDDSSSEVGVKYSEPYNLHEVSSNNVNIIQNANDITESLQPIEDNAGEFQPSITHSTNKIFSESSSEAGLKSVEYTEENNEESKDRENIADESNLVDQEGTQTAVELDPDYSSVTSIQPEITVGHAAFDSSMPSSPKSVLPENALNDQDPLSSLDQMIHVDVLHSTAEDSSLVGSSPVPHIEAGLVTNSMDSSSKLDCDVENMQELSSLQKESPVETNINNHTNELQVHNTKADDSSIEVNEDVSQSIPLMEPADESNDSSVAEEANEVKTEKGADNDATFIGPSSLTEENIDTRNLASTQTADILIREEPSVEPLDFKGVNEKLATEDIATDSEKIAEDGIKLGQLSPSG